MRPKSAGGGPRRIWSRTIRVPPVPGLLVCTILATAACGANPRLISAGGQTREGGSVEEPTKRIFYRVQCTSCVILFTTDLTGVGSAESNGNWQRTVHVPQSVAAVTLEVTPTSAEDLVALASIQVDGRTRARETSDPETGRGAHVTISAVVR